MDTFSAAMILCALLLCLLYAALCRLHDREEKSVGQGGPDYIVKMPVMLKYIYHLLFATGIVLFLVALIFRAAGFKSAQAWLMPAALAVALLGLLVMAYLKRFRISVKGDVLTVHRLFRPARTIAISELEDAEIFTYTHLRLFDRGKILLKVSFMCENFNLLETALQEAEKLPKEEEKEEEEHIRYDYTDEMDEENRTEGAEENTVPPQNDENTEENEEEDRASSGPADSSDAAAQGEESGETGGDGPESEPKEDTPRPAPQLTQFQKFIYKLSGLPTTPDEKTPPKDH